MSSLYRCTRLYIYCGTVLGESVLSRQVSVYILRCCVRGWCPLYAGGYQLLWDCVGGKCPSIQVVTHTSRCHARGRCPLHIGDCTYIDVSCWRKVFSLYGW